MSRNYGRIAFTDHVAQVQERYGSLRFYSGKVRRAGSDEPDALTVDEIGFMAERDGFYLATVSETGWPYVQFRGGPPGFVHILDQHTLAWADFRGNLQYISTGNLAADDRVALFAMDYPHRQRLKIFGHARIAYAADEPELIAMLADSGYDAVVERAVVVTVDAFDWNCPQHITPRFTLAEFETYVAPLHDRVATLEAELSRLRHHNPAAS